MRLMKLPIQQRLKTLLEKYVVSRYYPVITGVVAFGCALAFIPFVPVLILAVLLSPSQWWLIGFFTSIGSAMGGVMLILIFHQIGWLQVMTAHPEWFESEAWQVMITWLTDYGVWALAFIGATPFPQSPALLFLAMVEQSWWSVLLALAGGKFIKYGFVAYLVCYFPSKLVWWRRVFFR